MTAAFHKMLATANARIQFGNDERTAGADDKARAILAEVERRGRGGVQQVAEELGVSAKTISQACTRARSLPRSSRSYSPADTLEHLMAYTPATIPPLTTRQWEAVASVIRGSCITSAHGPGEILAYEVEDAGLDAGLEPETVAAALRSLDSLQAAAVIDACQRDDTSALPTTE